jgi:hypothetical protein
LVIANFGEDKWEAIKVRSGIDMIFLLAANYDDDITFKLAQAVSEENGNDIRAVLEAFGEWWVLKTTKEKYGG